MPPSDLVRAALECAKERIVRAKGSRLKSGIVAYN
jgi:hypothetical protein